MPAKALISISSMKVDKDSVRSILSSNEKTKLDTLAIVTNLVGDLTREANNLGKSKRCESGKWEITKEKLLKFN